MKIIELQAENVKRLKAVEITPDGTLQVIGGRNAQGKSSVLDAIWLALGGGKASKGTPLPIRDGETKARVRLDLGELVITRTWTPGGTTLKVENAEGAAYKSPQGMLDALLSGLSFDPLAFTRLTAKEQKEALLALVDLGDVDLDALDQQIKATFENRTRIGRDVKAIGEVTVDETLPMVEESATAIIGQIRDAQDAHRRTEAARNYVEVTAQDIEILEEQLAETRRKLGEAEDELLKAKKELQDLPPAPDVSALEAKLATVEETNAAIRANNIARETAKRKEELRAQYDAATAELQRLDGVKAAALADAKFPVDGLAFDDSGVTYRGVPLSQASSAEQIRVSVAMGMALNPKLRVLMIKDGSLLDAESMEALRQQVADGDYQLLIERVGNADEGAVIIEDGEVA